VCQKSRIKPGFFVVPKPQPVSSWPLLVYLPSMCGRYGESKILAQIKGKVPFFRAESALKPRYNIAPTQMAPVIFNQGEVVLKEMRWGLTPFWAKDDDLSQILASLTC
jgi:hypothetical protein